MGAGRLFRDIPADRMGPRLRLKAALDEVFAEPCPNVIDCVESKVFGIGLESMTVGSMSFTRRMRPHTRVCIICWMRAITIPRTHKRQDPGHAVL
ncbi:MAG: L-rhamnose isomerase [Ruthenibacterium lactatiformans]